MYKKLKNAALDSDNFSFSFLNHVSLLKVGLSTSKRKLFATMIALQK